MKKSHICPKCKSSGIIRLKAFTGTSTSNMIQLSKWGTHFAYFDRYLCTACGYLEHYANLQDKRWQKWLEKKLKDKSLDTDFV